MAKKNRTPRNQMKKWQIIANDISRSVDAVVRGKLDVEDAQEMILEGLASFEPGKERTAWLKANLPEFAALGDKSRGRASTITAMQEEIDSLYMTIEFIRQNLLGKHGTVDSLRALQAAAKEDAPAMIAAAQEGLLKAKMFDKGSDGLGMVLDKGVESLTRRLVLTSKVTLTTEEED